MSNRRRTVTAPRSAAEIRSDRTFREILGRFDVYYVGGVGFCGPDWQAAQAEWDAFRASEWSR